MGISLSFGEMAAKIETVAKTLDASAMEGLHRVGEYGKRAFLASATSTWGPGGKLRNGKGPKYGRPADVAVRYESTGDRNVRFVAYGGQWYLWAKGGHHDYTIGRTLPSRTAGQSYSARRAQLRGLGISAGGLRKQLAMRPLRTPWGPRWSVHRKAMAARPGVWVRPATSVALEAPKLVKREWDKTLERIF